MAGSYSVQSSVAKTICGPHIKSGGTKLVGENQTQQFETGLFGLKLLVWFALGVNKNQFGWNSKWMELVWFLKYINNKMVWCGFKLVWCGFKLVSKPLAE